MLQKRTSGVKKNWILAQFDGTGQFLTVPNNRRDIWFRWLLDNWNARYLIFSFSRIYTEVIARVSRIQGVAFG